MTREGVGKDVRQMKAISSVAAHEMTADLRVLKGATCRLRSSLICKTVLHRKRQPLKSRDLY